ncbi:hypothetical protein L6R50_10950 [Myxococcota bacterium]|nr:hypothetical protein [Myxococcota bacterium]
MSAPRPGRARGPSAAGEVAAAVAGLERTAGDLASVPAAALVADLDRVARGWLDPEDPLRLEALERVPGQAGLSREGVAFGLDAAFSALTAEGLRELVRREAGDASPGDSATVPRGMSLHVQAGNVFTAALPRLFASLLAGCPALLKAPGDQGAFTDLLARSFADRGGRLSGAVRGVAWRGDDAGATGTALAAAAVVVAYGSDDAVGALRAAARPDAVFLGFPHRASVAIFGRGASGALPDLLHGLALDVCAYDQRGCLSPQVLYVEEGGALSARDAAAAIAAGFPAAARALPPGPPDPALQAARYLHLEAARFDGEVFEGDGFAVCFRPDPAFAPGPGARVLDVRPLPSVRDLATPLAPLAGRLQGVAAAVGDAELPHLARASGRLGASRICRPGRLQRPPAWWRSDGLPILSPYARTVGIG